MNDHATFEVDWALVIGALPLSLQWGCRSSPFRLSPDGPASRSSVRDSGDRPVRQQAVELNSVARPRPLADPQLDAAPFVSQPCARGAHGSVVVLPMPASGSSYPPDQPGVAGLLYDSAVIDPVATLGGLGLVRSLIKFNLSLPIGGGNSSAAEVSPPTVLVRQLEDLPPDDAAVVRLFAYQAVRGTDAPSLMTGKGRLLASGDPGAIAERWKQLDRTKLPFARPDVTDSIVLKVANGRFRLCRLAKDGGVRERVVFGANGESWAGEWSITPRDGLLRILIDDTWDLYVAKSTDGLHFGFEGDALFVVAISGERLPSKVGRFLKVTESNQARIVKIARREVTETDPFGPGEWSGTASTDGTRLTIETSANGYRYRGWLDASRVPLWGDEEGVPYRGHGDVWRNKLMMLPIR